MEDSNKEYPPEERNKRTSKSKYKITYKWSSFGRKHLYIEYHSTEDSANESMDHLERLHTERPSTIFDIKMELLK